MTENSKAPREELALLSIPLDVLVLQEFDRSLRHR
jgi:hypothetical protein